MTHDAGAITEIDAAPTKSFFIDMLTRDISLEQAILDLVDNSVDGAKKITQNQQELNSLAVEITFNRDHFEIIDNCGGFDRRTAHSYAFKFGRSPGATNTPFSIGQFGVGMKRALFKFGKNFIVASSTNDDQWAIDVDVTKWETDTKWTFPIQEYNNIPTIGKNKIGTYIKVKNLRKEIALRFETPSFENLLISLIKSKHREFIAQGLSIKVNGTNIDATSLHLLVTDGKFEPAVDQLVNRIPNEEDVTINIIVGIGQSSPKDAGWYVICNGRVVLEADRSYKTGWGVVEDKTNSLLVPNYHNQFARLRGIVWFNCANSSRVPWNTTKTDIVQESPVWQQALARMSEMMRPVVNFLNELDSDIDQHTRQHSPLYDFVARSNTKKVEDLRSTKSEFVAPTRAEMSSAVKTVKIQYSKPTKDVEFLMKELGLTSAKAVGETTFSMALNDARQ